MPEEEEEKKRECLKGGRKREKDTETYRDRHTMVGIKIRRGRKKRQKQPQ